MRVKNWDEWQTYRKDRGTPPWIKVYRNLFSNPEWVELSDAEKGQLVSIWILSADKKGEFPDEPKVIQKMCMLDAPPNLSKFINLGFLVSDCQPTGNQLVTKCPQHDAPETETETETKKPLSSKKKEIARRCIDYLNEQAGKKFRHTATNIKFVLARLNEGFTADDLKWVIDFKVAEWKGNENNQYLRPATLFNAEKFNQYVGEKGAKQIGTTKHWSETATGIRSKGKELSSDEGAFDGFPLFKAAVIRQDRKLNGVRQSE